MRAATERAPRDHGKDTMGFLTESTLIPRKAATISGASDGGMAGIRAAMEAAASSRRATASSGLAARGALRMKTAEVKIAQHFNKGVAQRAAADEAARSARELSSSGEAGAAAAVVSTSLSVKERVYNVLAGHASPQEVLAAAAELGVCVGRGSAMTTAAGASLPPSLRVQLQKAAAEAAATLGLTLQEALAAAIAELPGGRRAVATSAARLPHRSLHGDDDAGSDEDAGRDAYGAGNDVMVDFALKRARAAADCAAAAAGAGSSGGPAVKRSRLEEAAPADGAIDRPALAAALQEREERRIALALGRDAGAVGSPLPSHSQAAISAAAAATPSASAVASSSSSSSSAPLAAGAGVADMARQAGYEAWRASHGSSGSASGTARAAAIPPSTDDESELQLQAQSLLRSAVAVPQAADAEAAASGRRESGSAPGERREQRKSRWDG